MDWVVKIGGSLFPDDAIKLGKDLVGRKVLIICGGGIFADKIREYDSKLGFTNTATHKSAILCMDILGILLADKIEDAVTSDSLEDVKIALDNWKLPVFLPSKLFQELNLEEQSWKVTSDSISFYIANLTKSKLLIASDVDGIYTKLPSSVDAKFIENISAKKLLNFGETSVDGKLSELLLRYKSDCYVVNGRYPERVISIIEGRNTKHTFIGGY